MAKSFSAKLSSKDPTKLLISVDLSKKGELSDSEKSYIVASTKGFRGLEELTDDENLDGFSLNLILVRKKKVKPLSADSDDNSDSDD